MTIVSGDAVFGNLALLFAVGVALIYLRIGKPNQAFQSTLDSAPERQEKCCYGVIYGVRQKVDKD